MGSKPVSIATQTEEEGSVAMSLGMTNRSVNGFLDSVLPKSINRILTLSSASLSTTAALYSSPSSLNLAPNTASTRHLVASSGSVNNNISQSQREDKFLKISLSYLSKPSIL